MIKVNFYNINKRTNYLVKENNDQTYINENDKYLVIDKTMKRLLLYNCRRFGNSFSETKKICSEILGISYKTPIFFNTEEEIILFPVHEIKTNKQYWIAFNNVYNVTSIEKDKSKIEFKDKSTLIVDTSIEKIKNSISLSKKLKLFTFSH